MADAPNGEGAKYIVASGDVRPIPDPTILTSTLVEASKQELRREITFVHDALEGQISGAREVVQARLDASDKAIILLQTTLDRIPAQIMDQVKNLRQLVDQRFETQEERFRGVQVQFTERDVRSEQSSNATKIAIEAALQAQKEMVAAQNTNIAQALARIEATSQKQIEQVVTLSQTTAAAIDGKINDIKDRLALIEGRSAGVGSSWGVIAAVIGFLIGICGLAFAVLKT